jgi:hypothetical protein
VRGKRRTPGKAGGNVGVAERQSTQRVTECEGLCFCTAGLQLQRGESQRVRCEKMLLNGLLKVFVDRD